MLLQKYALGFTVLGRVSLKIVLKKISISVCTTNSAPKLTKKKLNPSPNANCKLETDDKSNVVLDACMLYTFAVTVKIQSLMCLSEILGH